MTRAMPGPPGTDRLHALRTLLEIEETDAAKHTAKSEINVTPLVDVVLVLLIIFMVVTPIITSGVAVDLPRTEHHARKPDDGRDIMVSLTLDGKIHLGTTPIESVDALVSAVAAQRILSPEKGVFLKGDQRATYGRIREVMEALHRASVDDIVLGTEELAVDR